MAIVAPLAELIFRAIPNGKVKVALFRIRSGDDATKRDRRIMTLAVVAGYAFLACEVSILARL